MALQTVTLSTAADVFRVHPRTILRAIYKEHNTYWYEDSNSEVLEIKHIAEAYGVKTSMLVPVFEGRDALLRPDEAAQVIGMAARTFRKHLHREGTPERWGRISYGGIIRYLESRIISAAIAHME